MTPILVRVRSIVYETSEQLIKHNKLKVLLSCSPIQGEQSACIRARPTGTEPLVQWLFSTYVCVCTGTVSVKSLNHCLSRKVYVLRSTLHTLGNVSCFSLYSTHRESKRGKENGVTVLHSEYSPSPYSWVTLILSFLYARYAIWPPSVFTESGKTEPKESATLSSKGS